ncbi:MAG: HlyC/CorC family transporter [Rubrivivax sp.]|nr:HlyC/CorC family transporter [Rubrivivax sp.]
MELAILFALILLNGVFAMSEIALVAARKARLQKMIDEGDRRAQAAATLGADPTRFLSTIQIGITSIGVLNGIVGEAAFAEPLAAWLQASVAIQEGAARISATALVVVIITFLTIIFGELVPKRLGQLFPEAVARLVAPPMNWLSTATRPFVALLGACTGAVLRLMGIRETGARAVTEEEIAAQLEEGLDAGVIEAQEHQMVRNVFRLDDRQIGSMMIPRAEIAWLDAAAPVDEIIATLSEHGHSRYPVCRSSLDDVIGVLPVQRLVPALAARAPFDLTAHLVPPVFVPETLSGMELLEHLRGAGTELVFVVDEYGAVQGVITERDVLEAITGEFSSPAAEDAWAVRREDGSWLMDGLIPVPELKDRLELKDLPEEDRGRYNTLAGMILLLLGRLPATADVVEWHPWRFEVVDLDGRRIDKVLVTRLATPPED